MRCITCRTAPLAFVLGALVLTPGLVIAERGQEQGMPAQVGGQQGDAKPAEKVGEQKNQLGAASGGAVKDTSQTVDVAAQTPAQGSGTKPIEPKPGGVQAKPVPAPAGQTGKPAPAPAGGAQNGQPAPGAAREGQAGEVPKVDAKGPDARAMTERLGASVKLHEVRFARLDALLAVFQSKNDSAKLARTQELKTRENERYQSELATFKQSLGDETYKKVLASLRIARKADGANGVPPAPKPGEKPAADRGKADGAGDNKDGAKKDGEKKDGGR